MLVKVAVDQRFCSVSEFSVYICLHTLLCTYLKYFSWSLLLYPQLQLMTTTTAELSIYGTFSRFHASFYIKKDQKHLRLISLPRIIWHWLSIFLSVPLLSFLLYIYIHISPLFSSPQALLSGPRNLAHSEKHSWKAFSPPDQGDFLIIHSLFLSVFFSLVWTRRSSPAALHVISGKKTYLENFF